jgi:hypothetical protein
VALPQNRSSSSAKAGDPVRCGLSVESLQALEYWIVRPSAQLRTRRTMTANTPSLPAARFARALPTVSPKQEGAGNAGCLLHPRSRVQDVVRCAHEHTGTAGARRHSLRNGLTAYAELSLETNSFCLHRCRLDGSSIRLDPIRHRQLDISHGCQNHTVLPYASAPVILRAVSAHG